MVKSAWALYTEYGQDYLENIQQLQTADDTEPIILALRERCLNEKTPAMLKKGMEFLYINGFYEDMDEMIHKNRTTGIPSNHRWADVYELMMYAVKEDKSPYLILQQAEHFPTDEPELKCLLEFIKLNAYLNMNRFTEFGNFLEKYQHSLDQVNDWMLKHCFQLRLYQIFLYYHLMRNEVLMARKFGYRLINHAYNDRAKINAHIKMGLSYTFESYEQGMSHLQEALKLAEKRQLQKKIHIIKNNNIPFLSAHFRRVEGITTVDKAEQAHLEIAKGNNDFAVDILEGLDRETPFRVYYLGKAKHDREILLRAYRMFIEQRKDFFFSRLSLQAIRDYAL
ncbi:AimR family lysis-lysogeny pheromone receptor [Virgibacillus sediminis]|uniref:AimR family lysis-lysogeny pheromone receptor n=1 Tax=Virgibacillus sediminis TaxID=202260 RepID=A0ABV7A787_9BACI